MATKAQIKAIRQWQTKNKDKVRLAIKKYHRKIQVIKTEARKNNDFGTYAKYQSWYRLPQLKKRARLKNLEFDLTRDWYISKVDSGFCEISGHPFNLQINDLLPSIDRIDNKKGYTTDNCQVILNMINTMKSSIPYDKFIMICELVAK